MELRKAIQQVAKVLPRKKDHPYRFVRFLPGNGSGKPKVFATDGARMAVADVDTERLPDAMLESDLVTTAAKDAKTLAVVEVGYGDLEFWTDSTVYRLKGTNFDEYPILPPIPSEFHPVQSWEYVAKVFHAAAKEDEPELSVVHFTPDFVESLDKARLARLEVAGPWAGLVPASTFKSWPKGKVEVAFTSQYAFFRIGGEELRIGAIQTTKYPDTTHVVPPEHIGPAVLVGLDTFRNAVRQGTQVSELGLVKLEFTEGKVIVRAWQEGDVGKAFEAQVEIFHKWSWGPGAVLVNGKYLEQALNPVLTPNVKLGYGEIVDPLRVESGLYIACLWQMVY